MTCLICKQGDLIADQTTVTLERGSVTLIVKAVPAHVCANCGEAYFDAEVTDALLDMLNGAVATGAGNMQKLYRTILNGYNMENLYRGKRKLAAADLPHFAQALHVPIFFFFEEHASYDDLDYAVLNELHKLPSYEARQAALEIIRSFAVAVQSLTTLIEKTS